MAALDGSIVLIALPAIFRGIGINPLAPGETDYLLWVLMGYGVITATLLVTFGRISDMFGRVRLYNLGFAIFAVGSILLFLVQGTGNQAALQIIIFRLVQAVGGAFLFSNSTAYSDRCVPTTSTWDGHGHKPDRIPLRPVHWTARRRPARGNQLARGLSRQRALLRWRHDLGLPGAA